MFGFCEIIVEVFLCVELSWVGREGRGPMDPSSGCSKDGGSKGRGSKGGSPTKKKWRGTKGAGPKGGGSTFRAFFFLSRHNFLSYLLSLLGVLSWNFGGV